MKGAYKVISIIGSSALSMLLALNVMAAGSSSPGSPYNAALPDNITFHCTDPGSDIVVIWDESGQAAGGFPASSVLETPISSFDVVNGTVEPGEEEVLTAYCDSDAAFGASDCNNLSLNLADCLSERPSLSASIFSFTIFNPECGNGVVERTEQCDDGDNDDGDGCDNLCSVESGYACVGFSPSMCVLGTLNFSQGASVVSGSSFDAMTFIIFLILKVLGAVMVAGGVFYGMSAIGRRFGILKTSPDGFQNSQTRFNRSMRKNEKKWKKSMARLKKLGLKKSDTIPF